MNNKLLIVDKDVEAYMACIQDQSLTDLEIDAATCPEEGRRHIRSANILLGRPKYAAELLSAATDLQWVQSTYAGVEHLCAHGMRKDYMLTGIKEMFGPLVSEYVMAYILATERHLFQVRDQQKQASWQKIPYRSLNGLTLGIAGLGSIGQHLACTAAGFGMRVSGLKRRAEPVRNVDEVYSTSALHQFLQPLDYLVLALPDTPATQRIIDAQALATMRSSAVLINVGRGSAIDPAALTAALEAGRIKGAVLDVFEEEPLPPEHPLWKLPNVLITPHNAAYSFPAQIAAIFCDNYRRFVEGRPLKYVVDFERGY